MTDLVARFHNPTQGRILLNGTDIRDFRLATYYDMVRRQMESNGKEGEQPLAA